MRRCLRSGLLLLAVCLLVGCAAAPGEQQVSCNELTLTLPASFTDFTEDGLEEGLAFNYADVDMGICGSFEGKTYLEQYIPDMDPETYARLFLQTNGMDAAVELTDGIPCFQYSVAGYTYLCGVFESKENYWVVQCYCKAEEFSANRETMWGYIASVILG